MITLQKAKHTDIQSIRLLAEKIWLAHYPDIIGVEQTTYMLNMMYSEQRLAEQMNSGQDFYLIIHAGTAIGFIGLRQVERSDTWFIDKFYLDHEKQGSGLGSAAFKALMSVYSQAREFKLQVNRQNFKSINFYFKNGFKIERCLDVPIGDGYEMNDFVMSFTR